MTYTWANAEQTTLLRSDGANIPTDPNNRDYAEFLASGATVADYVAPASPPPVPLSEQLEAATGMTVAEIKFVLGLPVS